MPFSTVSDTARLNALLTEALALADSIGLAIAAIHIDEAISHLTASTTP